jgi:dihydroorotate dehydrogenase
VLYRALRPLLYLLPPEAAHRLIVALLRLAEVLPFGRALLTRAFPVPSGLEVRALGCTFPTPIGLAAGFDKDAEVYRALSATGFGAIEVGTITGQAQPGNPRPRLFRLPADRALINRMGFNNHGADAAAARLAAGQWRSGPSGRPVLGVNIGKTKLVSAEQAHEDYERSARLLGPYADYLVVNVSSPNTPGLRDLQAVASLRPILGAVRAALDAAVPERRVPLLVKIAPDLSDEDVLAVADLALELGLEGIVATNTTIGRAGLCTGEGAVAALGAGGLSGAPLKARALAVLRLLRARVGDRLVLVAAGGIESADDVWERLLAGASLVQVYSALVYEGPALPSRLARGLAERLAKSPYPNLEAAIGAGASGDGQLS